MLFTRLRMLSGTASIRCIRVYLPSSRVAKDAWLATAVNYARFAGLSVNASSWLDGVRWSLLSCSTWATTLRSPACISLAFTGHCHITFLFCSLKEPTFALLRFGRISEVAPCAGHITFLFFSLKDPTVQLSNVASGLENQTHVSLLIKFDKPHHISVLQPEGPDKAVGTILELPNATSGLENQTHMLTTFDKPIDWSPEWPRITAFVPAHDQDVARL